VRASTEFNLIYFVLRKSLLAVAEKKTKNGLISYSSCHLLKIVRSW